MLTVIIIILLFLLLTGGGFGYRRRGGGFGYRRRGRAAYRPDPALSRDGDANARSASKAEVS
jgi:hypothetical protein